MDNVFLSKKNLTLKEFQDFKQQKEERNKFFKETFNSAASSKFQNKLLTFAKEEESQTILEAFKSGAFPLINPALHNHRDRQKEKERDQYGGIYVRHYQEGKERANQTQREFTSTHLEGQQYNDKQPHLHPTESWLRIRDLKKEGPSLRYGLRIENEQILENLEQNIDKIDHTEKNMQMVHQPDWKKSNKNKWIDPKKGFNNSTRQSLKWSSNQPWAQIPVSPLDPYMGGFKTIEDKLGRGRDKKKEPKRNEFIGRVKDDPWGTTLSISKSVRTMKAEEAMHGDTDRFNFSKNHKLNSTSYKPSLIETKSVDGIVPFNHSNNFQGLQLKNMGQNYPRIYKNSLVHYGLLENQHQRGDLSGNYYSSFLNDQTQKSGNSSRAGAPPINKDTYPSPNRRLQDDQKQIQKNHQSMSTQSLSKYNNNNNNTSLTQFQDFRYNPPTDKQVSDAVNKYFRTNQ